MFIFRFFEILIIFGKAYFEPLAPFRRVFVPNLEMMDIAHGKYIARVKVEVLPRALGLDMGCLDEPPALAYFRHDARYPFAANFLYLLE